MMFIKQQDTELQVKRKLQKAGATLGFSKNQAVTIDMVRARFTELVKQYHPDTAELNSTMRIVVLNGVTLDDVRKAKDYLLKYMENDDA